MARFDAAANGRNLLLKTGYLSFHGSRGRIGLSSGNSADDCADKRKRYKAGFDYEVTSVLCLPPQSHPDARHEK
jgi:hypothetical protein